MSGTDFAVDASPGSARAAGDDVLCSCNNFTAHDLARFVADNDAPDFDALLARTGVGNRCSACLLDLEYRFCELTLQRAAAAPISATAARPEKLSLKRRLYRLVDGLAPMVHGSRLFNQVVPVVRGDGIEQFLWIANRSRFFTGGECAPALRVRIWIRDPNGRVLAVERHHVAPESDIRIALSGHLPAATGERLSAGSAEIELRWARPGRRGTTRPQVEIVSRRGTCSVHSQATGIQPESWLTVQWRPREQRYLFLLLNGETRPAEVEFCYPFDVAGVEVPTPVRLTLPPKGTRLYELQLGAEAGLRLEGKSFAVRYRCTSRWKLFAIIASPALDRMSIDHV
ncbi:MAG: (2Fe-2S)-binding protein [Candidatus Odyssella sp.]|nr:(2Fe-2S)-binding protein [Candidatus Odyssella sp.]